MTTLLEWTLTELPLAKASARPGQSVHSIGNPIASGSLWVYTSGTVRSSPYVKQWVSSGIGGKLFRLKAKVLETQSPTNPGDSGGPLVNESGELVAVTQGIVIKANAVNLFIDVSEIKPILKENGYRWKEGLDSIPGLPGQLTVAEIVMLGALLDHANPKVRARAAIVLGDRGAHARTAVDFLVKALKDDSQEVQQAAAHALGALGPDAAVALPELSVLLKIKNRELCRDALLAIHAIGPKGAATAGALSELLSNADADADLQELALGTAAKLGPEVGHVVPALGKMLVSKSANVRALAHELLKQVDATQVAALLTDPSPAVRLSIVTMLSERNDKGRAAIDALRKATDDSDVQLRRAAVTALGEIGPDATAALANLAKSLQDADPEVRALALKSVDRIGPRGEAAVLAVGELLKQPDPRLQEAALAILAKAGPDVEYALTAVAGAVDSPDTKVRKLAIDIVKQVDPTRLVRMLDDPSLGVRVTVAAALGAGGKKAEKFVDPLRKATKDGDARVRAAAIWALGEIGPNASVALPDLVKTLQDSEREVRMQSLRSINKVGPRGESLAVALGELLKLDDDTIQEQSLTMLAKLGRESEGALPAVGTILEGKNKKLQMLALNVLEHAGYAAGRLVPELKKCLVDSDAEMRQRVQKLAVSLNRVQEISAAYLPDMIKALQDPDRTRCIENLNKIQSLGIHAKDASLPVAGLYRDSKDRKLRIVALQTLTAMQDGAADAAPILLRDLIDPVLFKDDKPLHDRVRQAIVKIGRPAVNPLLKIASQDPLALNRFRAVQVIGEMGADVKDLAQNPLRTIQQRDTSLSVRAEAEAVLKKYGEAPR